MQIGLRSGPQIDKVIVAMRFRCEERYAIIERLAREVTPRVGG